MAFSSRPITINEADADFRTVTFGVYNTDGTPKTDLAPAKARLFENGAFLGTTTNDFAHVEDEKYSVILTQPEVNKAAQTHLMVGADFGSGYNVVRGEAVIVAAKVAATVGAGDMAANSITDTAIATAAVTKLQNGLATAAALATVAGYLDTEIAAILAAVDTEVAAIKAKTDALPASPAAAGDQMAMTSVAQLALVKALFLAANCAGGFKAEKDVPNSRVILSMPGEADTNVPAVFDSSSPAVVSLGA
jgi:hypothetical protein